MSRKQYSMTADRRVLPYVPELGTGLNLVGAGGRVFDRTGHLTAVGSGRRTRPPDSDQPELGHHGPSDGYTVYASSIAPVFA
ncbi:hypothetical protein SPBR_03366 [Sporothrix brasiliensis 5110]|uniref:Uncharacterized protein n=1 Tax=Sporothrix brasiliensis 5110 TaxID=1398154 RepID=A0A0C2F2Q1_9PEZI|nr:uncharacterized protein SPBR_03366 [Sporothrix brasiliensis 5110]KIH93144.1 hypothetical protein SPBR_03366 [Sporothrix brasiliensis 5110]